ncbi:xanthine dehydrogenase accessory protein XdhC [Frigidibacter sp. MR17.14]|uniref:xanthine dehydrogenase accessory protein XdhC n=1 Tax=Frigidibacter sp. MR17.14 TaxID=3126509 RepID=UPI003012B034
MSSVRIVVAAVSGSAPREAGTAMTVSATGQEGTIGGGELEWRAVTEARAMLGTEGPRVRRWPLGPELGQCCGGAVTLVFEAVMPQAEHGLILRRVEGAKPLPLALRRLQTRARGEGVLPEAPVLLDGWLAEAAPRAGRPLWIWGAGHVGRALVATLAPLPGLAITWLDTARDRFPDAIPAGVTLRIAGAEAIEAAPPGAEHLVLTFSHALDLEICHRLLTHGVAKAGLIGSETKAARFRSRLRALGHSDAQILRIACPIGDPALGKHPQAIAVGVAARLLREEAIARDTVEDEARAGARGADK